MFDDDCLLFSIGSTFLYIDCIFYTVSMSYTMFLRKISFILLLSSALRLEFPEYYEIELFAIVSLPRMTVRMPCSMLTLTTVPKVTSGELTDM